jgi:hypothetical protein
MMTTLGPDQRIQAVPTTRAEAKAKADALRSASAADSRIRAADAAADRRARERRARDQHRLEMRKRQRAETRAAEAERRRRRELAQKRRTARVRAVGKVLKSTIGHDRFTETLFYAVVLVVALAGQVEAASQWLDWPVVFAAGAVMALELGGVVLLHWSYKRRKLGERVLFATVLSGAVALFAVGFNFFGHFADGYPTVAGGFFSVMSALGYLVWLMLSAARVRDARREDGEMVVPPPAYGVWRWVRTPALTRLAAELHGRDPDLGLYGSLDAAQAEIAAAAKRQRVARLIRNRLRAAFGKKNRDAADFAIEQYDPDRVAELLIERADYTALVDVLDSQLLSPQRAAAIVGDVLDVEPLALEATVAATVATEPATESATVAATVATEPATEPATESATVASGEATEHATVASTVAATERPTVAIEPATVEATERATVARPRTATVASGRAPRSNREQRKPASPRTRRDTGLTVPEAAKKPRRRESIEALSARLDDLIEAGEINLRTDSLNRIRLTLGCAADRARQAIEHRNRNATEQATETATVAPDAATETATVAPDAATETATVASTVASTEAPGEVSVRPRLSVIRRADVGDVDGQEAVVNE